MNGLLEVSRIVASNNCEKIERLLEQQPCQAGGDASKTAVIKKSGYVLLDFGKEIHGSVVLAIRSAKIEGAWQQSARIRIVYGESVMEALSDLGQKGACNAHTMRDFVIEAVPMSTQPYGECGFRFVKIQPLDADIELHAVTARLQMRELEYQGLFRCNDERLNEIWKTAAYTVQLNMQDYLWDGIKRDRLVWIGDMHPEVSTICWVFGKDECVPKSLDFVRDVTASGVWMNTIPTYSMWWILIQWDWYLHWGDLEYLQAQKNCLKSIVSMAIEWAECDFAPRGLELEYFVDWPNKGCSGEKEGMKCIFCMALDRAAQMLEIMNEKETAQKCRCVVTRLQNQKTSEEYRKSVASLMILAGRHEKRAVEQVLETSMTDISTFMGGYLLRAKAKLGHTADALEVIRQYWGAMIDLGATTFWEDFDIEWKENTARIDEITPKGKKDVHGDYGRFCYQQFRHSLCHGWSSAPASFLIEKIAGVEILEPGCKKLKLSPDLAGLEWADISFPTPYGKVDLHLQNKNGKMVFDVHAPQEVKVII